MVREFWNDLRYRVRALVYRADAERDLHAEIEEHLRRRSKRSSARASPQRKPGGWLASILAGSRT
jgi:hypothetical protein